MNRILFGLVLLASPVLALREETVSIHPLPRLVEPSALVMNEDYAYIEDRMAVKMYDRKTWAYVRTLGRQGEGPGEFQQYATPQVTSEYLLISSMNKIVYFSPSGDYLKERTSRLRYPLLKQVGNSFVGYAIDLKEDDFYVTINLYDPMFLPVKELNRGTWMIHKNRRRDVFEIFFYDTIEDKIIVAHREGFAIDIFDVEGILLHAIRRKPKRIPFTRKDRAWVVEYRKELGWTQEQIEFIDKRTDYPDHFPPILTCCAADNAIYVFTYARKDDLVECLVYDLKGRFLECIHLPLLIEGPNLTAPFAINGGRFYQIIYNDAEERWDLHIHEVNL